MQPVEKSHFARGKRVLSRSQLSSPLSAM